MSSPSGTLCKSNKRLPALQMIWMFSKTGVPQNGWFIMENPIKIKIDDLGVPLFLETPILSKLGDPSRKRCLSTRSCTERSDRRSKCHLHPVMWLNVNLIVDSWAAAAAQAQAQASTLYRDSACLTIVIFCHSPLGS